MSHISEKANKLASALYLVTSFFSDQEPLKWKLRELSNHLISAGLSFKSYLFEERDYAGLENRQTVWEILSHLAVAKNIGLLSDSNHSLLVQEFSKYLENIGFPSGLEERSGQAVLSEKFFAGTEHGSESPKAVPEENIKDKNFVNRTEIKSAPKILPEGFLPRISSETKLGSKKSAGNDKPLKQFGAVSVKKNSRQSIIISLLKRKKEIMIKDISPLISGCSEKTIQRELLAMVATGILRKIGEKRWSRYTLV